ncbi:sensor histidine kinase [Phenylobacterium sp.]|jgi:two-component system CheB/CheR fusion protein|uniref:sensor histidine kinase n=1 Tax=Phenylobacterium sp. TaxID=1871053 RepID=UPI002F926CD6
MATSERASFDSELNNLLESTQIAVVFVDNDLRLRSFTRATSQVFHLTDADIGRPLGHLTARIDYPELEADVRKLLKSLAPVEREVASAEHDRRFLARLLPHRSANNAMEGVVATFVEIPGRSEAETALHASERRFGEAQNLAGVGIWEWDLDTDESWWSPVVYRLWGLPEAAEPPPTSEWRLLPDDRAAYESAWQEARESGAIDLEWRIVRPDGSVRWLAATGRMQQAESGRRMLGVTQDITERKQTETRLRLLLGELQHRVRNILAVVRSIVVRSVRKASSMEELASHLEGRLSTLARTQSVFSRTGEGAMDLEEIIREELLAVAAAEDQLEIDGPELKLKHEAAETVSLAIHELTTNALKYGALSEPNGRLKVQWRIVTTSRGPRLSLVWQESGVRALPVAPARSGFGRELIERGLPHELGATTALEFRRGGVRATIEMPLSEVSADLSGLQMDTTP